MNLETTLVESKKKKTRRQKSLEKTVSDIRTRIRFYEAILKDKYALSPADIVNAYANAQKIVEATLEMLCIQQSQHAHVSNIMLYVHSYYFQSLCQKFEKMQDYNPH